MGKRAAADRWCLWLAAAAALAASLYWGIAPSVHEETYSSGPGAPSYSERTVSLVESDGAGMIPVLILPVLLAALPLALGARKRVSAPCGGLLFALSLLGSMTIGFLYFPAAALLLIATGLASGDRPSTAPGLTDPAPRLNENPLP